MGVNSKDELIKLLQVLRIEKREELEVYTSLIKNKSIKDRRSSGICWYPVKIKDSGYGIGDYPYIIAECPHANEIPHQFQSGKMAGMFREPSGDNDNCQGVINYVDGNRMKITFYMNDLPDWVDEDRIGINLLFDEYSMREMEHALEAAIKAEKGRLYQLREVLSANVFPGFKNENFELQIPALNKSQNEAVNHACSAEDVAVIHGPPGTGKTTTLVEIVRQLVKKEKRILVCAPSNAATDLLTEKIAEAGIKVIRTGNISRIDETLLRYTIEHLLYNHETSKEIKKYKKQADELRRMASKYKRNFGQQEREQRKLILNEARNLAREAVSMENVLIEGLMASAKVITTTLTGSAGKYLDKLQFDTVIVDEASQALEPATWIPLLKADKLILAGDPYQLPPTVKSAEAQSKGLGITLIEKCILNKFPSVLLRTQYRMNEVIMGYSNAQFYEGKLIADDSVKNRTLLDEESDYNKALEFIDTAGCGFEEETNAESTSYFNTGEYKIIINHLKMLYSLLPKDQNIAVGVVSPYKQQVNFMREMIPEEDIPRPDINTIDSFQGQERDVIYISLVRSNDKGEIGFLSNYRRMNVAMTRARKKLVVVGDSATLGSHKFYRDFLAYAEKYGMYRTGWEYMDM